MNTTCYPLLRGRAIRLTSLHPDGSPIEGADQVTVSCVARVQITEVVSAAGQTSYRSDLDRLRLRLEDKVTLVGFDVAIDLIGVNTGALAIAGGAKQLDNGFDVVDNQEPPNFMLEVWSRLGRKIGEHDHGYTVFPRLRGGIVSGTVVSGNGSVSFSTRGARTLRMSKTGALMLGGGWDTTPWDTEPWDEDALIQSGGGRNLFFRTFPVTGYPEDSCAPPLLVVDGGFAEGLGDDVIDGEWIETSDDVVDGGGA